MFFEIELITYTPMREQRCDKIKEMKLQVIFLILIPGITFRVCAVVSGDIPLPLDYSSSGEVFQKTWYIVCEDNKEYPSFESLLHKLIYQICLFILLACFRPLLLSQSQSVKGGQRNFPSLCSKDGLRWAFIIVFRLQSKLYFLCP